MKPERTGRGGRWTRLIVAAVAVLGATLVAVALIGQEPSPPSLSEPIGTLSSPDEAVPTVRPDPGKESPSVTPAREVPLGPSPPVSISIEAIGVESRVIELGKAPDGTLEVPQPGPDLDKAAWFNLSPTPGQPGPSVIEGHVSTDEGGPSIFFELADLRPGDKISVTRRDGTTVVFTVDALREFPKSRFPTQLVYGGDLGRPTLRLITCSNFDPEVGGHTGNLVVFSHLTKVIDG